MGDSDESVDRASASADFLEWSFSLKGESSPWSVEQSMTQLLAHENAEGIGLPLADAVPADAAVIHELGRRRTPTAVAALRGFQAMSTIDTQRELARLNADRLVGHGLPEPPWADTIGRVDVDCCRWTHDPYGETAILLCGFSYGGTDEHGILTVIDQAIGGGRIREVLLGARIDSLGQLLDRAHGGEDGFVTEPLDPALARRLLEDAVATSDELMENPEYKLRPMPDAYRKMRALTLARARALSDVAAPPEPFPTTVEIELLKRAFLASEAAAGFPTDGTASRAVDLLVEQFVEQAACHPLQLGPRRVLAVLGLPALAAEAGADPVAGPVLPDVAAAWVGWTATERGLSPDARERLVRTADQACAQLRSAIAGGDPSV
ncbi:MULTISPECIES: hypothetical protein [unclassified Micromonospora]|uniref:hypothetical protein n=1 Tax=unclassified Micromonospora TaxID=2617518 RepID=UPI003A878326